MFRVMRFGVHGCKKGYGGGGAGLGLLQSKAKMVWGFRRGYCAGRLEAPPPVGCPKELGLHALHP